jgi:tetratricopeptide (TPR) repeat protein
MSPELIERLLSEPEFATRLTILREASLLDEDGLWALLGEAGDWTGRNPIRARDLAEIVAAAAEAIDHPTLMPPANYLQAQTYAMAGEFEAARSFLETARDGYLALDLRPEALRTNAGLMSILGEMGRYEEALEIAGSTLASLETLRFETAGSENESLDLLEAKISQNLATCLKHLGRYEAALEVYAIAEANFAALDMIEPGAEVMMNRAIALLHLGRGNEALDLCLAAAETFNRTGNRLRLAQALENSGNIYLMLGDFNRSLAALEQSDRVLAEVGATIEQFVLAGITADAYLALNLYPEAVTAYRQAEAGLRAADMVYELAWVLLGLGAALSAMGQYSQADVTLAEAAALFKSLDNRHLLAAVLLEQAALLAARGEQNDALVQTRRALELVGDQEWPVQRFFALLRQADLIMHDDTAVAEALLGEAGELVAGLPMPHLRFRWLQRTGRLYLAQGREQEAEVALAQAVRETEQVRGTLAREAMRVSFLRDKTTVYEDLIQIYLNRGDEAGLRQAFQLAEQAKSRALVDWLANVVDATLDVHPDDPELVARLESLQADLNAAYNELLGGSLDGERTAVVSDVSRRIRAVESEIAKIHLTMAAPLTEMATLDSPTGLDSSFHQPEDLPGGMTLLAYHLLGEEVLAFIYRDGRLLARRKLTTRSEVATLLGELAIEWDRFRADPDFVKRHLSRMERSAAGLLQRLYKVLIAPLEANLSVGQSQETPRLAIVPHDLLHQVPFHALYDGQRYLLERFQIGYAPSATVLALNRRRLLRRDGRAIVMGVADALIPHVTREAQAVAESLPATDLLLGEAATVSALEQHSASCRLLHLACHGLFRADNPQFSALKLSDGWLTAADVGRLSFSGAFVTLSACESGRSEVTGGDETIGLIRAFLRAGAVGLVVSLWLVEDETTAELMTSFYQNVSPNSKPWIPGRASDDPNPRYDTALRDAQLAIKERYPHPYYWAPFIFVGRA